MEPLDELGGPLDALRAVGNRPVQGEAEAQARVRALVDGGRVVGPAGIAWGRPRPGRRPLVVAGAAAAACLAVGTVLVATRPAPQVDLATEADVAGAGSVTTIAPAPPGSGSTAPPSTTTVPPSTTRPVPEQHAWPAFGEDALLTGSLTIGADGCTSVDGTRLAWPPGTTLDQDGARPSLRLVDGRSFTPGDRVSLGGGLHKATELVDPARCPGDGPDAFFVSATPRR